MTSNFQQLTERYPTLFKSIMKLKEMLINIKFPSSRITYSSFNELYYNIPMFIKIIEIINSNIEQKNKPVFQFDNLLINQLKIYDYTTYRGKTYIEVEEEDILAALIIAYLYSTTSSSCPFVLIKTDYKKFKLIYHWNIYSKTKTTKKPINIYL